MENNYTTPAEPVEPAWLHKPCPGGLPWTSCMAHDCECSRQVLILTCLSCGHIREHSLGERVAFECADPDCGGWVLTARLIEPDPGAAAPIPQPRGETRAVGRVREFLAAHAENRSDDLIATEHYHDGMGHAIAVLRAGDLRTLAEVVDR